MQNKKTAAQPRARRGLFEEFSTSALLISSVKRRKVDICTELFGLGLEIGELVF